MRRGELLDFVSDLVKERWNTRADEDLVDAILEDEAFDGFAATMNRLGGGDEDGVADMFDRMAARLTDAQLDWMQGETTDGSQAEHPAAFLTAKAKEVLS